MWSRPELTYPLLLVLKFVGVMLFAGGYVAAFVASEPSERRRAVHDVASPGLGLTWLAGFLLTLQLGIAWNELWILGGFLFSLIVQLTLVYSVERARRTRGVAALAGAALFVVVLLMVLRPTWSLWGAT